MKLSSAKTNAIRLIKAGITPYLISSPGIGKSAAYHAIAKEFNLKVIDVRASTYEPTDFTGLPKFFKQDNVDKVKYVPFDVFPTEGTTIPDGYDGWLLLLDEVSSANKSIQAPLYKVILDRMIDQKPLHKNVVIGCAGNLSTDGAIVNKMSTALVSRLATIKVDVNKDDFISWGIENGIDSRILGFIEYRPTMLHNMNPDVSEETFACPRTYEMLSKVTNGTVVSYDTDAELFEGIVGKSAALEFIAFCEVYQSLPSITDIVNNPTGTPIPEEKSTCFALATYLADNITKENAVQIMQYVSRLPIDFQVVTIRIANARVPSITTIPEVTAVLRSLIKFIK